MKDINVVVIQQDVATLEVLGLMGYNVMEATDCIEGLRLIIRYQPDLVISMMKMPSFNAIAMAEIMELFQIPAGIIFTSPSIKDQKQINDLSCNPGFIVDSAIEEQLAPLIEKKLMEPAPMPGSLKYKIRQREWADLSCNDHRKRILIIDDSAWAKKACMMAIDQFDSYALFSASDGLEGVVKALLVQPDLIISDFHMPNLDGLAMSQIFYILNQPFPIVFLTGDVENNLDEKSKRIGGIIGVMLKAEMRDQNLFIQKVSSFIERSEVNQKEMELEFQKGSVQVLAEGEKQLFLEGKGLCTSGAEFRPGMHHIAALRRGSGGLGEFFK